MRTPAEIVAVFLIRGRSVVVRTNTAKWLKFMIDIVWERRLRRWLTLWSWIRIFHSRPCPKDVLTYKSSSVGVQHREAAATYKPALLTRMSRRVSLAINLSAAALTCFKSPKSATNIPRFSFRTDGNVLRIASTAPCALSSLRAPIYTFAPFRASWLAVFQPIPVVTLNRPQS